MTGGGRRGGLCIHIRIVLTPYQIAFKKPSIENRSTRTPIFIVHFVWGASVSRHVLRDCAPTDAHVPSEMIRALEKPIADTTRVGVVLWH